MASDVWEVGRLEGRDFAAAWETREPAVLGCLILPLSGLPPDKSPLRKLSPSSTGSENGKEGADFPPSWLGLVCFPTLYKVTTTCVCVCVGEYACARARSKPNICHGAFISKSPGYF